MAIQTYQDLKAAVADWMDRPELAREHAVAVADTTINVDPIGVFVSHVEATCNRRLRTEDMATLIFNSGCEDQSEVLLPDNILGLRLVMVNNFPAEYLTPEQFSAKRYTDCEDKHYFTRVANQLHVWPEMAVADDITMVAYVSVPPLVNDDDVNWLLRKFPDVYLYGCLAEACAYVYDEVNEAIWRQKFDIAIQVLIDGDKEDKWPGGSLRIKSV